MKWHQFIWNDEMSVITGLPSICETNSRCHNALFVHVARLPDDVPFHKALNCQVNLSLGRLPSSQWNRVILVTDGVTRSGVTTTFHQQISGGLLQLWSLWSDAKTLAGKAMTTTTTTVELTIPNATALAMFRGITLTLRQCAAD